jgi:subtilisin family serine protease
MGVSLERIQEVCEASLLERLLSPEGAKTFLARAQTHLKAAADPVLIESAALLERDDDSGVAATLRLIARLVGAEAFEAVAVGLQPGLDPKTELERWQSFGYPPFEDETLAPKGAGALLLAPYGILLLRVPPHQTGRFLGPLVQDANVVRLYDPLQQVRIPQPIKLAELRPELIQSGRQVYAGQLPRGFVRDRAGEGIRVAVIDSGIDHTHPALRGKVVAFKDFTSEGRGDFSGHGTHCAGIIGGGVKGDADLGVAPGVRFLDGKVFNHSGKGETLPIAAAIRWAADEGAQVISLSLGGAGRTDGRSLLSRVANAVAADGVVVVVSSGNSGHRGAGSISVPGDAPNVLTVGAVDSQARLAPFSSRGPTRAPDVTGVKPNLVAPGVGILSARSKDSPEGSGRTIALSGTSMAAPHVAGAAAAVMAFRSGASADQVKAAILAACTPVAGSPTEVGKGLLNVTRALADPGRGGVASLLPKTIGSSKAFRGAALVSLLALAAWALAGDDEPSVRNARPSGASAFIQDEAPARRAPDPLGWGIAEEGRAWDGPPTARNSDKASLHPPNRAPDHVREGCYRYWVSEGVIEKVVVRGDSLGKWSAWYSVDLAELADWNGFHAGVQLLEGDRLLVSTDSAQVVLRQVTRGDTLSGLLRQYGIPNPWYVRAWNCILKGRRLQAGSDVLILPVNP